MNYFLNYNANCDFLSFNSYANPNAIMCATNDVDDFINDVVKGIDTSVCIDDKKRVLDLLSDGGHWNGSEVDSCMLEKIYDLVNG